jgi:hypothetical protein
VVSREALPEGGPQKSSRRVWQAAPFLISSGRDNMLSSPSARPRASLLLIAGAVLACTVLFLPHSPSAALATCENGQQHEKLTCDDQLKVSSQHLPGPQGQRMRCLSELHARLIVVLAEGEQVLRRPGDLPEVGWCVAGALDPWTSGLPSHPEADGSRLASAVADCCSAVPIHKCLNPLAGRAFGFDCSSPIDAREECCADPITHRRAFKALADLQATIESGVTSTEAMVDQALNSTFSTISG